MSRTTQPSGTRPGDPEPMDVPLGSPADLIEHFRRGEKPETAFRVGLEHEKIGVVLDPDGGVRPVPYRDEADRPQITHLLSELARRGWQEVVENGNVIALRRSGASITIEPGGQLELSGSPLPDGRAAAEELDRHLGELLPMAEEMGVIFLGCGFRPLGTLADVPHVPKGRYKVMREYLPARGRLSLEMMHRTATVQANFDYRDEADAIEKLRLGLSLSSLVTAMFAASPIVDGRPAGYKSYRAACWLETDPDRCGLLPFIYEDGASYERYAEWALDVPMFFVYRDHTYMPARGMTFRGFMAEGFEGERATLSDWDLHLSTLFPEARMRRYIEVRGADAGPIEMVRALPCLWQGLLYDADARRAAWDLIKGWSLDEREALRREVPVAGMAARVRGQEIRPLCLELVRIAEAGLLRQGDRTGIADLDPLREAAASGRAPAEHILELFEQAGGDARAFVESIRYRAGVEAPA